MGHGSSVCASAGGLDPGERADVPGDHRQLSGCYLLGLGRCSGFSLSDGRIISEMLSFVM